ncbi:TonB-dependent receptor [Bordetella holmesii]|nr:TonB-dependent receptor [Bordetella holmesii]QSY67760.1 TonB-dependent receptor [Bordetella holmesii]
MRAPRLIPTALALALALSAAAHAQTSSQVTQLPAVSVKANDTAEDDLENLRVPVNSGALGNRSQLETPFATTVVGSTELRDRQISKLGDVFALDASVNDNGSSSGAWASYLTVRGLQLDWQNSFRIDGNPFPTYVTVLPYEQLEQIDLLKGATGFMYGFGSPGGMINYVTKKPTDDPLRAIDIGVQSNSLIHEHIDLGGRGGPDDRFGYRLNATHEEGSTYNDRSLYRTSASLALDARLTEKLTWDFQTIYQDRKTIGQDPTINSFSLVGTRLPSPVRQDDDSLVGQGSYVKNHFRYYNTGLKYQINNDWSVSTNYSYSTTETRRNEVVLALLDSAGNYDDQRSDYGEAYGYNQWRGMIEGKFETGALKHQLVAGASWQKQKNDYSSTYFYGSVGTGNLYQTNHNAYYSNGNMSLYRAAEITQKAVFASDTIDLTHGWSLLGGLRVTDYSQKGFGVNGARNSEYDKNGVLTPTVALMYNITPRTMAYASYIESLEAGSVVGNNHTNAGTLLDPLKSKQYELGLKTEQDDWAATAALFRIERKTENPVVDPNTGRARLEQNGLSRYQGLELAASTRLAKLWTLGGSLMFLDSEYRKGTTYNGNRVAGAPRFVAAAQLAYSVPQLPGLKLRADVRFTGSSELRQANDIQLDNYTLVNIDATYDTRIAGYETTFRAGINNLANKRYWLYQTAEYIKPGDPRTYSLSATVKF